MGRSNLLMCLQPLDCFATLAMTKYWEIFMRSIFVLFFVLILTACTSSSQQHGKPLPQLTFDHVQPLTVSYQLVSVENRYDPKLYPDDRSSHFFMSPHIAVEEFLRARIQPSVVDHEGRFRVVIDEAIVTYRQKESENRFGRWFDLAGSDEYDIAVSLRLLPDAYAGPVIDGRVLKFTRTASFSEHVSIAEREAIQLKAIEALIADINVGVTRILTETMGVVVQDLGPPKLREEHDENRKQLQAPQEHPDDQNPFGAVR